MITAFLPCRSGSERVAFKNTREFCSLTKKSILEIKIEQLILVNQFDKIIISTNDPLVKEITSKFFYDKRVVLDHRPEEFSNSETQTDDLIKYVNSIIADGDICWTHATSPFADAPIYANAISEYKKNISNGYDSLMSVCEIRKFLWKNGKPYNYDYNKQKWPKTQDIEPIFEVNSALFIANKKSYRDLGNRIGEKPFLFKMDSISSFDIDWEYDFMIAQRIYNLK